MDMLRTVGGQAARIALAVAAAIAVVAGRLAVSAGRLIAQLAGRSAVGARQLSPRQVLFAAGLLILLGTLLIATGVAGVAAIVTNLVVLGLLVMAGSGTRSLTEWRLILLVLAGCVVVAPVVGLGFVYPLIDADPQSPQRAFVSALIEEGVKLLPLLALLWLWRRGQLSLLGATDVLLMGAAIGAGFGLVEDAYLRAASGWGETLPLLLSTEIVEVGGDGSSLRSGHLLWTALAAGTIGLWLALRRFGRIALAVAVSGYAWVVLDHAASNARGSVPVFGSEVAAAVFDAIRLDGYATPILLGVVLVAAVLLDLRVLLTSPRVADLVAPRTDATPSGLLGAWRYVLDRRALAYAADHRRASAYDAQPAIDEAAAPLFRSLRDRAQPPG